MGLSDGLTNWIVLRAIFSEYEESGLLETDEVGVSNVISFHGGSNTVLSPTGTSLLPTGDPGHQ